MSINQCQGYRRDPSLHRQLIRPFLLADVHIVQCILAASYQIWRINEKRRVFSVWFYLIVFNPCQLNLHSVCCGSILIFLCLFPSTLLLFNSFVLLFSSYRGERGEDEAYSNWHPWIWRPNQQWELVRAIFNLNFKFHFKIKLQN